MDRDTGNGNVGNVSTSSSTKTRSNMKSGRKNGNGKIGFVETTDHMQGIVIVIWVHIYVHI
jgi:hypothetical protein